MIAAARQLLALCDALIAQTTETRGTTRSIELSKHFTQNQVATRASTGRSRRKKRLCLRSNLDRGQNQEKRSLNDEKLSPAPFT